MAGFSKRLHLGTKSFRCRAQRIVREMGVALGCQRIRMGKWPTKTCDDGKGGTYEDIRYKSGYSPEDAPPVIVIDTLSIALGGEDEKGPKTRKV